MRLWMPEDETEERPKAARSTRLITELTLDGRQVAEGMECLWCGKRLQAETVALNKAWDSEGEGANRKTLTKHTGGFGLDGENLFCSKNCGYQLGKQHATQRFPNQAKARARFRVRASMVKLYESAARLVSNESQGREAPNIPANPSLPGNATNDRQNTRKAAQRD